MKSTDQLVYEFLQSANDAKVEMMAYGMADYLSQLDINESVQAIKQLAAMLDNDKIYSSGVPGDNPALKQSMMSGIDTMKKACTMVATGNKINENDIDHDDFPKTASLIIENKRLEEGTFRINGNDVKGRNEDANMELARQFVTVMTKDPTALRRAIETAKSVSKKIREFLKLKEKEISDKTRTALERLANKSEEMSTRLMKKCNITPQVNTQMRLSA